MCASKHNIYLAAQYNLTYCEAVFTNPEIRSRKGGPRPLTASERVARFWSKVERSEGCWLWRAGVTPDGYGLFNCGRRADGRQWNDYAHRIAFILTHGPIDGGLVVRHACDTPPCCNPDHLLLGTQADNIEDARRQGKYRWTAERCERAKSVW